MQQYQKVQSMWYNCIIFVARTRRERRRFRCELFFCFFGPDVYGLFTVFLQIVTIEQLNLIECVTGAEREILGDIRELVGR